jgi:hypothetical protein
MILNNSAEDCTCPKCNGELEWDSGSDMENETWYCSACYCYFEVQVEMVRFWDTLKECE